jgi:hypothetical protein
MIVHVVQKIARMVEGEYVFVQAIKAFIDSDNVDKFLKTFNYQPAENFNGVECIVEIGVVQVEVEDADQFFGGSITRK